MSCFGQLKFPDGGLWCKFIWKISRISTVYPFPDIYLSRIVQSPDLIQYFRTAVNLFFMLQNLFTVFTDITVRSQSAVRTISKFLFLINKRYKICSSRFTGIILQLQLKLNILNSQSEKESYCSRK